MTSPAPRTPGFLRRSLSTLPWLAVFLGPAFALPGLLVLNSLGQFTQNAIAADVHVVRVDTRNDGDRIVYRPVFEVPRDGLSPVQYAGDFWVAPQPHDVGDRVPGRYDPASGEIRSDRIMAAQSASGEGMLGLGIAVFLAGSVIFVARWIQRAMRGVASR